MACQARKSSLCAANRNAKRGKIIQIIFDQFSFAEENVENGFAVPLLVAAQLLLKVRFAVPSIWKITFRVLTKQEAILQFVTVL